MKLFERLTKKAQENPQRLVLPESLEPRTLQAAERVITNKIADVTFIGNRKRIEDKAFELGCEQVVVILTKPVDVRRVPDRDIKLAKHIQRKYPNAACKFRERAELYNTQIERLQAYAEERRVIIIAPDDTCGVDTLTRDAESMKRLYEKGYKDAQKIPIFLYSCGIEAGLE